MQPTERKTDQKTTQKETIGTHINLVKTLFDLKMFV